jgi:hypothetical protein
VKVIYPICLSSLLLHSRLNLSPLPQIKFYDNLTVNEETTKEIKANTYDFNYHSQCVESVVGDKDVCVPENNRSFVGSRDNFINLCCVYDVHFYGRQVIILEFSFLLFTFFHEEFCGNVFRFFGGSFFVFSFCVFWKR